MIPVLAVTRRKQPMSDTHFTHTQDQLKQLAQDVLAYAREQGGTDCAVEISEGSGLSVSVRKSKIETIEQNKDKGMGVTVFIGQRRGNASTSDFRRRAEGHGGGGLQHRPLHRR
jgi:PmbA protein